MIVLDTRNVPSGIRIPAFPSSKTSLQAGTSVAIIGSLAAIASIKAIPNPSDEVVENAKISALANLPGISNFEPMNIFLIEHKINLNLQIMKRQYSTTIKH